MNHGQMAKVVRGIAERVTLIGENNGVDLADESELLRVLARLIEGRTMDKAFGPAGDWGYDTPIGAALSAREEDRTDETDRTDGVTSPGRLSPTTPLKGGPGGAGTNGRDGSYG